MNLLDGLKMEASAAIDAIRALAAIAGTDCEVSVVISHPGTAEDAFVVGQHEIADLYTILHRLETGPRAESDVSASSVGEDTIVEGKAVQ